LIFSGRRRRFSFIIAKVRRPQNNKPVLSNSSLFLLHAVHSAGVSRVCFYIIALTSQLLLVSNRQSKCVCTEVLCSDQVVEVLQFPLSDSGYQFSQCADVGPCKTITNTTTTVTRNNTTAKCVDILQPLVVEPEQRLSVFRARSIDATSYATDRVLIASADDVIWPWMRFHGNGMQATAEPAGRLATTT